MHPDKIQFASSEPSAAIIVLLPVSTVVRTGLDQRGFASSSYPASLAQPVFLAVKAQHIWMNANSIPLNYFLEPHVTPQKITPFNFAI